VVERCDIADAQPFRHRENGGVGRPKREVAVLRTSAAARR